MPPSPVCEKCWRSHAWCICPDPQDAEIARLREALIEARLRLKQAYLPDLPVFARIEAALAVVDRLGEK